MATRPIVTGAVEGDVDEAVLRRILDSLGLQLGPVYGRKGKPFLLRCLNGYNSAARFAPWAVLVDLDRDCPCASACVRKWLASPAQHMYMRVAVRAIEAWLLGDRDGLARFLGIRSAWIATNPDNLDDPKAEMVDLARRSQRRSIRTDLVPRDSSGRSVGPLYTTRMIEFIQDKKAGWRPERAPKHSLSLARSVERLRGLVNGTVY